MDIAALNPYSRRFFEFLQEHEPVLAAAAEVDHSHHWEPGALKVLIAEHLTVSTHEAEITLFFDLMHVHLDDFADALALLREIQNEETLCAEWRCGDEALSWSLVSRKEPLVRPFQLTKPTQVRLRSFRGTFDELRDLDP